MRIRFIAKLILGGWLAVGSILAQVEDGSGSLEALIAKIPQVAHGDSAKDELAKQIGRFGPAAIPRMIALLESKDHAVAEFAGYVVRDLNGLTEDQLDALIKARQRGDRWIPPAIARIGTPRAIAFLVEDIKHQPEADTQVTWALGQAGEKAALPVTALLHDSTAISAELALCLHSVFAEMGAKAKIAVPELVKIATDESLPTANRQSAVDALGSIGPAASMAVPALGHLAKSDPANFKLAADRAIVAIGTPDAVGILVAQLSGARVLPALRDIAALGKNGRSAGPALIALLGSNDQETRVGAARALGYIGYAPAVTSLQRALFSPENWQLAYVAAESLGRMRADSAVPDLRKIATDHWSPVVRQATVKALKVIQGTETYPSRWPRQNFAFEFFEYQNQGYGNGMKSGQKKPTLSFIAQADVLPPKELKKMSYPFTPIAGNGGRGGEVKLPPTSPSCAFRFNDGLLIGLDLGEWGGELAYLDKNQIKHSLILENTHAFHRMPFGVVATVGLAHMMLNSGSLYVITMEPGQAPSAKLWKVLPGEPGESGVLENGDLFISCVGGDVLITPSGEIRRVESQ